MRVLLVYNAEAGADDTPARQHILDVIQRGGHTASAVTTRDNWRAAITDDHDLVVAAGGDGTVRRVASAMAGRRLPMTILPLGTANNSATALGLAGLTVEAVTERWASARRRSLDLLVAKGPWGESLVVEGVGLGLFAATMAALDARRNIELAHIDDRDEKVDTVIRRLRERLSEHPSYTLQLTLDGREIPDEFVLVEALNIPFVGPNLHLAPDADPTDGLMDVVLVDAGARGDLDRYFARRLMGEVRPVTLPIQRGRVLTITWTGFELHMDDTTWPGTTHAIPPAPATIEIRVDPGSLQFLG
jgi:diacylglycerol kinase family enzyme